MVYIEVYKNVSQHVLVLMTIVYDNGEVVPLLSTVT